MSVKCFSTSVEARYDFSIVLKAPICKEPTNQPVYGIIYKIPEFAEKFTHLSSSRMKWACLYFTYLHCVLTQSFMSCNFVFCKLIVIPRFVFSVSPCCCLDISLGFTARRTTVNSAFVGVIHSWSTVGMRLSTIRKSYLDYIVIT